MLFNAGCVICSLVEKCVAESYWDSSISKIDYCLNVDVFSFQITTLVCNIGKDLGVTTSCRLKIIKRDWFLAWVYEKTTVRLATAPKDSKRTLGYQDLMNFRVKTKRDTRILSKITWEFTRHEYEYG